MKYLSGQFALNLPDRLGTPGDWHSGAMNWAKASLLESNNRFFGDYGIEKNRDVPFSDQKINVANHIRASLDLIEQGEFAKAHDMNIFIGDEYREEVFDKVYEMKEQENFEEIKLFMMKEYGVPWIVFLRNKGEEHGHLI